MIEPPGPSTATLLEKLDRTRLLTLLGHEYRVRPHLSVATGPTSVGVLLGGGYMVFALGLAGLLVYLYRKDGDIQEMLSNCRWARYFTLALSVVGALMVYFSSLLLYTALAVVGIAFFVTAASYAEDIEFDKA